MKIKYCWRCKCEMPFLDEDEWTQIEFTLFDASKAIIDYRTKHKCDLNTARLNCKPEAMIKFEELTGVPNVHFEIIYHHRLINLGDDCKYCGFPLRTPRAKFCAKCGESKQ